MCTGIKNIFIITVVSVFLVTANEPTVGLIKWVPEKSYPGYTLFPGKHVGAVMLIDNAGMIINSWEKSTYEPGQSAYLLPDGSLIRCALLKNKYNIGGGEGGRFEKYSWDGKLLWAFNYATENYMSHHDIAVLPNGNILAMCVEKKTIEECVEAGFNKSRIRDGYVSVEFLVELKQTGFSTYEKVWEWHLWDHLIQDYDTTKANYGTVVEHPELVDVHGGQGKRIPAFWNHGNSVDYNAKFDQICLSIRGNSEFWIIDHSTTTKEAAGHTGGTFGKGGDLLYRWGNPESYDRGTRNDRVLYQQHDAQWIPDGYPGAGNILIYNNGIDRPGTKYSSIEEVELPCDSKGVFPEIGAKTAWLPVKPNWTYTAKNPADFYSAEISGVQRLPNGNTLICEGLKGHFFEITPQEEIVWSYINPLVSWDTLSQGDDPTDDIDPRGHQHNAVFKIHRYPLDYPAFKGKTLKPLRPVEKKPWPFSKN